VAITVRNTVTHAVPPLMMGCHTDLGYDHQIYGFYSQMVHGESFENYTLPGDSADQGNMWEPVSDAGVVAAFPVSATTPLHGLQSQSIVHRGGSGRAGVANRGFKRQGLVLRAGKRYEGSLFVRPVALGPSHGSAGSGGGTGSGGGGGGGTLVITLEDYFSAERAVLATTKLPLPPAPASGRGEWVQLSFNLTVAASAAPTPCRPFPFDTPPLNCKGGAGDPAGHSGHACVQCGGQLVASLHAPGAVDLDFAELHPGEWGRYKGLPVKRDSVEWLQRAGIDSIRTGGTYVKADTDQSALPTPRGGQG
jgi:hypothetical protein